jgi:formate dehydrogenase assembly factor FdhD
MHGSQFGRRDRAVIPAPSVAMSRVRSDRTRDMRVVAEECPVALVYDGTTIAVLMATPTGLADLAVGFSLTEGIIQEAGEIEDLDIVPGSAGIRLRVEGLEIHHPLEAAFGKFGQQPRPDRGAAEIVGRQGGAGAVSAAAEFRG